MLSFKVILNFSFKIDILAIMLFSNIESLEDIVLKMLLNRATTVIALKKTLESRGIQVTVQAIYKVLRNLIREEVLIKQKTTYSVSEEWRVRVLDGLRVETNQFELAEGEKVSFELASLVHLDQQWKNIVLPLQDTKKAQPVFMYNPHEIWSLLSSSRKISEKSFYESFVKNKSYLFNAIGGSTIHDNSSKLALRNEYVQVVTGKEYFPKTDYPTIFGDYIVTTRISPRVASEVENIYKSVGDMSELEMNLQKIGLEKKKVRLILERDAEKARRLRKKLAKDFYIQPALIEQFNLF
jgi:hypothetical protein